LDGGRGFLRTAKILACCLLVFPLVGTAPRSGSKVSTQSLASSDEARARRASLDTLLREGEGLFQARRYPEARQRFEAARGAAVEANVPDKAARALGEGTPGTPLKGSGSLVIHSTTPFFVLQLAT
jgi:hypothetical protein